MVNLEHYALPGLLSRLLLKSLHSMTRSRPVLNEWMAGFAICAVQGGDSRSIVRLRQWLPLVRTAAAGMAAYREDGLVAVPVIIRMFVAPLPVLRLFVSLQPREFSMCFVPSLLPGLVGTAFVLVPGMTIPMVAVVISIVGAVFMPIAGLEAHGRNQGRTQQKRA
jgi:hypothetical protein